MRGRWRGVGKEDFENIKRVGMIELLNVDCMEYLKDIPDKHFELAIVDPPYGIGASNIIKYGPRAKFTHYKKADWDNRIPNLNYFSELFRTSKNQIIWGGAIISR